VIIQLPSLQSLLLLASVRGEKLGAATGFVVIHDNKPFLITNWHVAAGRNPQTGETHPSGATPDTLTIRHFLGEESKSWQLFDEALLGDDGRPLWLEHPKHGRDVDVVALPLTNLHGVEINPHNVAERPPDKRLQANVSDWVNIVGFPFGISGGAGFAIWTKGGIASEPDIDWGDLPRFLIDARTRKGQSGSPVFAFSPGGPVTFANGDFAMLNGPSLTFLGVYSGRINEQSDLGIVWKSSLIREILAYGVPGDGDKRFEPQP
jgi:hypothetical protein